MFNYLVWSRKKNCIIETPQSFKTNLQVINDVRKLRKKRHLLLDLCVHFDKQNNYSVCSDDKKEKEKEKRNEEHF